jgi:hypothetical protein
LRLGLRADQPACPGLDFPRIELPDTFTMSARCAAASQSGPISLCRAERPAARLRVARNAPGQPRRALRPHLKGAIEGGHAGRAGAWRRPHEEQVRALPGRPAAFAFVPQSEVLGQARIAS